MNRLLFLPLNRNMLYFARRVLARGHMFLFKRKSVGAHEGHCSKLHILGFFKDDYWRDVREIRCDEYKYYKGQWERYFNRFKITHIVKDSLEANISCIAALDVAGEMGIVRCYVQHGQGDIYDVPSNLGWYNSGVYDYFYATSKYVADWVLAGRTSYYAEEGLKVRKFSRQAKQPKVNHTLSENGIVLYAPMFNWPCDPDNPTKLGLTGLLLDNERRRLNNGFIVDFLHRYGWDVLYCHDPKLDTQYYGPCYKMLEGFHDDGKITWVQDKASKYLDRCDVAMTDIGSGFFFEAISRGKPAICLHHTQAVQLKRGTRDLFGDSIQWFGNRSQLETRLADFIKIEDLNKYVPKAYLDKEMETVNNSLVWEE